MGKRKRVHSNRDHPLKSKTTPPPFSIMHDVITAHECAMTSWIVRRDLAPNICVAVIHILHTIITYTSPTHSLTPWKVYYLGRYISYTAILCRYDPREIFHWCPCWNLRFGSGISDGLLGLGIDCEAQTLTQCIGVRHKGIIIIGANQVISKHNMWFISGCVQSTRNIPFLRARPCISKLSPSKPLANSCTFYLPVLNYSATVGSFCIQIKNCEFIRPCRLDTQLATPQGM